MSVTRRGRTSLFNLNNFEESVSEEAEIDEERKKREEEDRQIIQSKFHKGLLKASWKLLEKSGDPFDLGQDVQGFFSLYRDITLEDLSRMGVKHSKVRRKLMILMLL